MIVPTDTPEYKLRLGRMPGLGLDKPRMHGEYVIDCLGGRTKRKYLGMSPEDWARHSFGGVLDAFAPSFSEDYYDWLDLFDAVADSDRPFTMVELGAGYGRWLVHGANLAAKLGRPLGLLVGCEAEPTHYQWMMEHFRDNGYAPEHHRLRECAIAGAAGSVPFYIGAAAKWYGQSIAPSVIRLASRRGLNPGRLLRMLLGKARPMDAIRLVPAATLAEIIGDLGVVDFMHVDIQGAEYDALSVSKDLLNAKVAFVHVGTHAPTVEATRGRDMDALIHGLFQAMGWNRRFSAKPGETIRLHGHDIRFVDGVQSWANPRLRAATGD